MRRADPDRIVEAKQEGLVSRIAYAIGRERAEAVYATYADQATAAGLSPRSTAWWSEAEPWIAAEVARLQQRPS